MSTFKRRFRRNMLLSYIHREGMKIERQRNALVIVPEYREDGIATDGYARALAQQWLLGQKLAQHGRLMLALLNWRERGQP